MPIDDVKSYLGYLDKEMTIMGVLSAFSVAVPALVIERVAGTDKDSHLAALWIIQRPYFLVASASLLLAAFFFYRQRSHLAWLYGQLCLSVSPIASDVSSTNDLLHEADSWRGWLQYRWAFAFLFLGFLQYGVAIANLNVSHMCPLWLQIVITIVITIVACGIHTYVLWRFPYSESPWWEYFKWLQTLTSHSRVEKPK